MINNQSNQIPAGYKQTDVGIIPSDWTICHLEEIRDKNKKWSFTGGPFGSSLKSEDYTKTGIRIIQLQNIGDGIFYDDSKVYTSTKKADELLSNNIYPGDVLLSKMGDPVARACIVPDHEKRYVMCSDGIRVAVNKKEFNSYFIKEYINSKSFRLRAIDSSTGSTRMRIGIGDLKKLFVIKVPKLEQDRIVEVLSDIDSFITKLSQLIQKKRHIRHGAMQELLTGKRRLPGFSGEWETRQLIEIANFYDNYRIPVTESKREKGTTPYFGANGIQGYIKGHTHDGEFVLVAEDGANDLNNYPIIYVNGKIWVNNHAHVIQGIDGYAKTKYLSYALKTVNFVQVLVGGTRAKLNGSVAKSINIRMPTDMLEQTAIAQVLSDMDAEIEALEKQKAKYIDLKQGMMQQLLTGKIRLI